MPVQICKADGKSGFKWGQSGKCFIGTDAKARAVRQGRAIEASINNRTEIVPSNPLKADPSRTITLRRIFERDFRRRFDRLKGRILDLIVVEDAFGLKRNSGRPFQEAPNATERRILDKNLDRLRGNNGNRLTNQIRSGENLDENNRNKAKVGSAKASSADYNGSILGNAGEKVPTNQLGENLDGTTKRYCVDSSFDTNNSVCNRIVLPVNNQRWRFLTTPEQVKAFQLWLQSQITTDILTTTAENAENAYWRRYVEEGYRKGAGRAFDDVKKPALAGNLDFFDGTKQQFLEQSFGSPVAVEKVKLLAGRVFTELKGVTEVMAQQMSRILTDGLVRGDNVHVIARALNDRVERIGKTRATIIARTEIIRAHAEGQLDALEQLGVTEVGVAVEWSTAGDDRVCPLCLPLEGVVMKIKEARGIIPRHAQCRCAYIPANVGEPKTGQKRSKTKIDSAIDKSIRAEVPKKGRTLAQRKKLSRSPIADVSITKKRPKGIL